jgi:hypothetical protein
MSTTRYSRLDSDSERLPENMTRIGYDAATSRYQYQDTTDGSYWEGPPGSEYGVLRPVGWVDPRSDDERQEGDKILAELDRESWRYMFPWFLLCGVFLLGVWWVVGGRGFWSKEVHCIGGLERVQIRNGDTCWKIAGETAEGMERLRRVNEWLNCERLGVGDYVCVPGSL